MLCACTGFSRWEAAKAQLTTASLGTIGAVSALMADDPRALGKTVCRLHTGMWEGTASLALLRKWLIHRLTPESHSTPRLTLSSSCSTCAS